jgi:hypothetical protein
MQLRELLRGLDARQSFNMIASALKQNGLDVVSQGWGGTSAKIEALAAISSDKKVEVRQVLERIYLDNILYSQKAVLLWVVEKALAQKIADLLPSFVDESSPYGNSYPLAETHDNLLTINALGVPTGFHEKDGKYSLVFVSKREKVEEEELRLDEVPDQWRKAGFTQFFGKKRKVFQVFDSITVTPAFGIIEMRIDQAKALSEKDILKFKDGLSRRFNELVKDSIGIERILGQAINLEPALVPLYNGRNWIVHNISHQNDGGYNNTNKGKFRTDDVRKDLYHTQGEAAVGAIDLWHVNAAFKSSFSAYSPMLVLEGHSSMLNSMEPFMDIARILDCATETEYLKVFMALLQCLELAN